MTYNPNCTESGVEFVIKSDGDMSQKGKQISFNDSSKKKLLYKAKSPSQPSMQNKPPKTPTTNFIIKTIKFDKKGFVSDNPKIYLNDSNAETGCCRSYRSNMSNGSVGSNRSSRSASNIRRNENVEKKISYGMMVQKKASPSKNAKPIYVKPSVFKKEVIDVVIKNEIKYKTLVNSSLSKNQNGVNSDSKSKSDSQYESVFFTEIVNFFGNLNQILEVSR